MKLESSGLRLSATDLAQHLGCAHLTQLERAAAEGKIKRPYRDDPLLETLRERGMAHEAAYADALRADGVDVQPGKTVEGVAELMASGVDVIFQAPLALGPFFGIADFLRRVETPTGLGAYGYEVVDTKLAAETRAGTILQLCLYSEAVAEVQQAQPLRMQVVKPGEEFETESFLTSDFGAYFRLIRSQLAAIAEAEPDESTYPEPVDQCQVCTWWSDCDTRRRADDHLSLVAGMSRLHADEFRRQGTKTLEQLGGADTALAEPPTRGSERGFERLHAQAQIQAKGRAEGQLVYEMLDLEPERGLACLPLPTSSDIFFDIEAARHHEGGGLEYLFGWSRTGANGDLVYKSLWAHSHDEERRAFEAFIDMVMAAWEEEPGMHVYHFAPYEPTALKRLMGRYGTRMDEVNRLLRGERFVDLHRVATQSLRASVEQYSLKDLEQFPEFERAVDLRKAARARRSLERQLDVGGQEAVIEEDRVLVEAYNRDDCGATAALRDWLEERRDECVEAGATMDRPEHGMGEASESRTEASDEIQAIQDQLMARVSDDREEWTPVEHATWLLAQALRYYERELNPVYWEMFRLQALEDDEPQSERKALGGLVFEGAVEGTGRHPTHRYRMPTQECDLRSGDDLKEVSPDGARIGSVVAVGAGATTVDIKKRGDSAELHPEAVFACNVVLPGSKLDALMSFGRAVADTGLDMEGDRLAARDLLLQRGPRTKTPLDGDLVNGDEDVLQAARRLALDLDGGCLAIQGPPGTGKTFTGSRMIVDLILAGHRVGVTGMSHQVVWNLLEAVNAASEGGTVVSHYGGDQNRLQGTAIQPLTNRPAAIQALADGSVVGGTAWHWCHQDMEGSLDYLFVDEAGQMSLVDVLAMSRSTQNIVLLGDPQQLEQPQQGSHPEGTEVAALVHLLGGRDTIPPDRGLFLDRTYRLHPSICAFNSELYYEGRLTADDRTAQQAIHGPTRFAGSGLFVEAVPHVGNQNRSPEEAAAVQAIVRELLSDGVTWTNEHGEVAPLTLGEIMIVAPYNAHVAELEAAIDGGNIGTVDRFQGREAAVVIYSMAASSPAEAPRGMEFLYNPNRLNVATSRARAICILVAAPSLFEPECRTPKQMRMANGLCRYRELAEARG
jgi:uncharacterized protein